MSGGILASLELIVQRVACLIPVNVSGLWAGVDRTEG